jgi:hypothetical protein
MAYEATFSDPKHLLNPDEVPNSPGYRDEVLAAITERLDELFQFHKETDGLTTREFGKACGGGVNKGSDWLKHPETMGTDNTKLACKLFGVSIDYLQCKTDMPDHETDIWSKYALADSYGRLSDDQKRLVTNIVRELNKQNYYRKRMREYAPYALEALT